MNFNILIVDDSDTTRALIRRALQMADLNLATPLEAPNGKVALQIIQANHIDLVLADLHMPEMNGVELAHAILGNPATRAIPVAIISAEPSATRIAELRKAGVKGYLKKPFTPESIRNLIKPFVEATHGAIAN